MYMKRALLVALCSVTAVGCSTTGQVNETATLFQQMRDEQAQQMAELRDQISQQSSNSLTIEQVAAIVEERLAVKEPAVEPPVQPAVQKRVTGGEFMTAEMAENCIVRIMSAASDMERPTSAKMAAYVCSHVYGLNHQRTLEAEKVLYDLGKDNRKFDVELKQYVSNDDNDIVLDQYQVDSLIRTGHKQ